MDPQKLSQLDPKLREAYQRVMGTPIPQPQAQPVQAQTPPMPPPSPMSDPTPVPAPQPEPTPTSIPTTPQQPPTPEPQSIPTPEPAIPEPQPAIPQPEPLIPEPNTPQQPPAQASNFVQMNSEVAAVPSQNFTAPSAIPQTQTLLKKKNGIMLPILFGVVGLVFIGLYTLFWTKIFNFKLPFLP